MDTKRKHFEYNFDWNNCYVYVKMIKNIHSTSRLFIKVVHSIDKSREDKKDSENTGIKESTRESVCRSVKDNGRFENKLWGLYDYGAD